MEWGLDSRFYSACHEPFRTLSIPGLDSKCHRHFPLSLPLCNYKPKHVSTHFQLPLWGQHSTPCQESYGTDGGRGRSMDGGKEWLEKGVKKLGDDKATKIQVRTSSQ